MRYLLAVLCVLCLVSLAYAGCPCGATAPQFNGTPPVAGPGDHGGGFHGGPAPFVRPQPYGGGFG